MSFVPEHSTDEINRGQDLDRCLSDDLDTIEENITALQNGKADSSHTHSPESIGAAPTTHAHEMSDVNGLDTALGGKAASNHTHTPASIGAAPASHTHEYAAPSHSHEQSDVTGLATALAGKAAASHTHQQSEVSGLSDALAAKANASALTAKADLVDGKVPASQLPSFVDDVVDAYIVSGSTAFSAGWLSETEGGTALTPESDKIYIVLTSGTYERKTYRWSGTVYAPVGNDLALGETSATAYRGDRGKTAYEHSQDSTVHVTAAQKTAWDSKAAGDHTHNGFAAATHAHAQNDITGLADALAGKASSTHSHSYDDLSDKPTIPTIPSSLPANGGNSDTVDGKHASEFAAATHSHAMSAITGLLDVLLTDSSGGVNFSVTSGNMLSIIAGWAKGVYTAYFMGGTAVTNIPKTSESWRCIVHKTGSAFGWVLAFGTSGSVFSNYLDNGTWKGWRAIYDANPAPLWGTSGYYMTAGHTVTPSKKLSECAHGWLLLWSDYDPDTSTSNEKDFWATMIPNKTPSGGTWSSKLFYCDIPRYIGDNLTDMTTEKRVIKQIYVSDDKIVGHDSNNKGERTDVVLRAVYEF